MIERLARELAEALRNSPEAQAFSQARRKIRENEPVAALLLRFCQLRQQAQMCRLSHEELPQPEQEELKKLGELLQFYPDAAEYLIAEYALHELLAQVYAVVEGATELKLFSWEAQL